jgi:hypothetical protein
MAELLAQMEAEGSLQGSMCCHSPGSPTGTFIIEGGDGARRTNQQRTPAVEVRRLALKERAKRRAMKRKKERKDGEVSPSRDPKGGKAWITSVLDLNFVKFHLCLLNILKLE